MCDHSFNDITTWEQQGAKNSWMRTPSIFIGLIPKDSWDQFVLIINK